MASRLSGTGLLAGTLAALAVILLARAPGDTTSELRGRYHVRRPPALGQPRALLCLGSAFCTMRQEPACHHCARGAFEEHGARVCGDIVLSYPTR